MKRCPHCEEEIDDVFAEEGVCSECGEDVDPDEIEDDENGDEEDESKNDED